MARQVRKIYKYILVMVKRCEWCNASGIDDIFGGQCDSCNGQGGEWKRQRVIVGEVITE